MNYTSYKELLKDERISLSEEKIINDSSFIFLKLEPKNEYTCPLCGSNKFQRYGTRKRKIILNTLSHIKESVFICVSRIKCLECNRIYHDQPDFIHKKEKISYITKINIIFDLKRDLSFKEIALNNNVSSQTVIDIFDKYVLSTRNKYPEVICIDEFKNLKNEDGKYAFLILDPMSKKIIDILPDRKLETLKRYFRNVPVEERRNVKYIISDMYEGYRTISNLYFQNATHIVDSFHYIRYVTEAFNKVKIRIMNSFNSSTNEYKNLKRYWKILLKYSKDINCDKNQKKIYNYITSKNESILKIIDSTIDINQELTDAYFHKEGFIKAFRETKYEDAKKFVDEWILKVRSSNIKEFNELMTTFINWRQEIISSFLRFGDKRLHNGYIEGMNNHIKVIKRISYGYRNFERFKKRIMYIVNEDIKIKSNI